MQLPSDLHDNSRWMGFTVYAIYTVQKQEAGLSCMQDFTILLRFSCLSTIDEVPLLTYTAFPLSRDAFDESSQRLLVFYIPRLLCEMNRCSHIEALFESDNPSLEVEMCGIRLVYEQDVEDFVQTLVEYMLGNPDVYHPAIYENLEVQLRKLQGCNHGKDFSCSFTQERLESTSQDFVTALEFNKYEICESNLNVFLIMAGALNPCQSFYQVLKLYKRSVHRKFRVMQ